MPQDQKHSDPILDKKKARRNSGFFLSGISAADKQFGGWTFLEKGNAE
jgi:hypothetical protein